MSVLGHLFHAHVVPWDMLKNLVFMRMLKNSLFIGGKWQCFFDHNIHITLGHAVFKYLYSQIVESALVPCTN